MNTWIKELLKNLDKTLEEPEKIRIMEACGEQCPFTHLTDERLLALKKASRGESDFLEKLSQQWWLRLEETATYVVFDRCYCPLVNEDIEGTSATLCYCTLGNLKKKFRLGLGQKVDIIMEKTILNGDEECRFRILL